VLSALLDRIEGGSPHIGATLGTHAAKELLAQRWVRLGQAGHPDNQPISLGAVAIDLPATPPYQAGARPNLHVADATSLNVGQHVLTAGDSSRRGGDPDIPQNVVLIGGPGQGKSTIAQLLCQAYRVALLEDRPDHLLGTDAARTPASLKAELVTIGIEPPNCRRWPVHVPLSEYADAVAGGEAVSLLRWIAQQVSRRTPDPVTAGHLREWLRTWPWFIAFDGLDEVAAASVRETVLAAISEFQVDAAAVDADLMIFATTRPQGYGQEFNPNDYEHLQLRQLNTSEAIGYATKLAAVRHADDPDTAEQVVRRVTAVTRSHHTGKLMVTPLQVTIMSLLLERYGRAPSDHYGLFDAYYRVIYDREVAKNTPEAALLDQQRSNIDALHAQVGEILQRRAEQSGEAESHLPATELRALAVSRLTDEGYDGPSADRLADRIVAAATARLVLLVGRTAHSIGYEIRSLQEFMAARSLTDTDDEAVVAHLRELATSAHWRNTWLFAAGRIFRHRQHLRNAAVNVLADIDSDGRFGSHLLPGTRLACDLLNDDIGADAPLFRRLLVRHALGLLSFFPGPHIDTLGWVLLSATAVDPSLREHIDVAIQRALDGNGRTVLAAAQLLAQVSNQTGSFAAACRQKLDRVISDPATALTQTASAKHPTLTRRWLSSFGKDAPKLLTIGEIGLSFTRAMVPKANLDPDVRADIMASLGNDWVAARLGDTAGNTVFDSALTLAYALPASEWLTASQFGSLSRQLVPATRREIDAGGVAAARTPWARSWTQVGPDPRNGRAYDLRRYW
jgi:hypothetical protein